MSGKSVLKVSRGQIVKGLLVHAQNGWDLGTDWVLTEEGEID